jgi:hypothetical protein
VKPNDQILDELRRQTSWLRLLGIQTLRPLLDQCLRNERHRLVYEYSDGSRSVRDVARIANVGVATVSRLWGEWLASGICTESPGTTGRAQHLVSLSALGLSPLSPGGASETDGGNRRRSERGDE